MWKTLPAASTNCGQESGACVTSVDYVHFICGNPRAGPFKIAPGPRTTGVLVEIYTGVDNAHELVLEFIDLVSERGQFDLLAGAKISFDADAVLVSEE